MQTCPVSSEPEGPWRLRPHARVPGGLSSLHCGLRGGQRHQLACRGQTNKLLCHSVCGEPRRFWGPEIRATAGPAGPSAAVPLVSPSFPGCRAALRRQRVLEHGWGTPEHPQGPVASAISSREGVKCLQMDYLKRRDAQKEGEPAGTVRVAHPARCQAQGCPSACPWPVGFSF